MSLEWVDVHTHINMLEDTPENVIARAGASGVKKMITIGTNPEDHPIVLSLATKYQPHVYCTLGVHPHDAKLMTPQVLNFMRENCVRPQVVAIGEIGLDYYYKNSSVEEQLSAFRAQMRLAKEAQLPVEIHTRDAEADTLKILEEFNGQVRGILHCFTGTQALANAALDLGYNISISGVVTFKNAEDLRNVVKSLPLERMHVETDAPFLSPVPMRGKKNEPSFVVHTAEFVAKLRGISTQELSRITNENAYNMFPKLKWEGVSGG